MDSMLTEPYFLLVFDKCSERAVVGFLAYAHDVITATQYALNFTGTEYPP